MESFDSTKKSLRNFKRRKSVKIQLSTFHRERVWDDNCIKGLFAKMHNKLIFSSIKLKTFHLAATMIILLPRKIPMPET